MVEMVHTLSKRLTHIIIKSWAVLVWQVVLGRIFLSFAAVSSTVKEFILMLPFLRDAWKAQPLQFDIRLNASVQWMYTFVGDLMT